MKKVILLIFTFTLMVLITPIMFIYECIRTVLDGWVMLIEWLHPEIKDRNNNC